MNLAPIRPGDVVKVDDGLEWFALVHAKLGGGLKVQLLTGDRRVRPVKARQIIGHWRKSGQTRAREFARDHA